MCFVLFVLVRGVFCLVNIHLLFWSCLVFIGGVFSFVYSLLVILVVCICVVLLSIR